MTMINFPAHTGLKPRKLDSWDRICIAYFRAITHRNPIAEIEKQILSIAGSTRDDLDLAFSSGRFLDGCTFT